LHHLLIRGPLVAGRFVFAKSIYEFTTPASGRLIALREHMDLCLQSLDERSVKTGNCLSEASFAG